MANNDTHTSWDEYYQKPYLTARITRLITGRIIASLIRKYVVPKKHLLFAELGGGNSCFYERLNKAFVPQKYTVIDNNKASLDLMKQKAVSPGQVSMLKEDVLALTGLPEYDLVFSVGLIEHFQPADTARVVATHFKMTLPGGLILVSFPTPTWLYRITRKCSELLGLWIFKDERPLPVPEVLSVIKACGGEVLATRIIWPIFLTQAVVVAKKPAH